MQNVRKESGEIETEWRVCVWNFQTIVGSELSRHVVTFAQIFYHAQKHTTVIRRETGLSAGKEADKNAKDKGNPQ